MSYRYITEKGPAQGQQMGFNNLFGGGMPGITMQQPQQPPAGANSFNSMFDNSMFSSMFGNMGGNSQPSRQTRGHIIIIKCIL